MALDKVAFLPFGLLVDQWRWKVFSGEVTPADYNKAWWELRTQVPGRRARRAAQRGRTSIPGAKYHVPGEHAVHALLPRAHPAVPVPPRAVPRGGLHGPLHRCSIYGNKAAGAKLDAMLEMGASRPWPEALEALTGEKQMDATAMLDYFAPLKAWLEEQNQGRKIGWK